MILIHFLDLFPERWFDKVIVLTTDNSILYSRLEQRGYSNLKIQENVECEIMQIPLQEALDSYNHDRVIILKSETVCQMEVDFNIYN